MLNTAGPSEMIGGGPGELAHVPRPIYWREGLAQWRRSDGNAYMHLMGEEPARTALRHAAVNELLAAMEEGVDLTMRYVTEPQRRAHAAFAALY